MFLNDPNSLNVNVTVLPGQTPNYSFQSPIWVNNQLVMQNNGNNGFLISFIIQPPAKPGDPQYYFPPDAQKDLAVTAQPLVNPNDACPSVQNGPGSKPWSLFKAKSVSADNKTLVVRDPNPQGKPTTFGFTLWVTTNPDGSGPYLPLDPIGDNQDGPINVSWGSVFVAVVAVAAVAVFALYEVGLFAR
jgi:hypothetical protein